MKWGVFMDNTCSCSCFLLTLFIVLMTLWHVFYFWDSIRYTENRKHLIRLVNDGLGIEALPEFLRRYHFHIEANFLWALIALKGVRAEGGFNALSIFKINPIPIINPILKFFIFFDVGRNVTKKHFKHCVDVCTHFNVHFIPNSLRLPLMQIVKFHGQK